MRFPAADKALRRLVVQLAAAAPEDVDLVLESLDPAQAARVRTLLSDYAPETWPRPALGDPEPTFAPEPAPEHVQPGDDRDHLVGLSPWLAACVGGRAPPHVRLTRATLTALDELARKLPAEPVLAFAADPPGPKASAHPLHRFFRRGGPPWR